MAMSIEELELETAQLLPAREVMSTCCRSKGSSWHHEYNDNDNQDFDGTQFGLLNVQALNNVALINVND